MDWHDVDTPGFLQRTTTVSRASFSTARVGIKFGKTSADPPRRQRHLLRIDDERFIPIFEHAGSLDLPISFTPPTQRLLRRHRSAERALRRARRTSQLGLQQLAVSKRELLEQRNTSSPGTLISPS